MFNSLALANSKIGQLTIKLARLEKTNGAGWSHGVPTGKNAINPNKYKYTYRY